MKYSNIHPVRAGLTTFLDGLGVNLRGAEIGVREGEFSSYLLENMRNLDRLYSVDSWRHIESQVDASNVSDFEHATRMRRTAELLSPFGDRSVVVRATSEVAAELIPNGSLDFVYLDAAHDFDSVLRDCRTWAAKIRRGGILCGDDFVDGVYQDTRLPGLVTHFGVRSAVERFALDSGVVIEANSPSEDHTYLPQWWIRL